MPHLKINSKLKRILQTSKPIKVVIGGRSSGKSIGFGDIFTMKMETEKADIYCLREFQDSISDSVHRVFKDSIEKRLQLKGWSVQENKIISPVGSRTRYKGASRSPDSIQSAQGYKYSWFEEAHTASKESLDKLLPTILRNPGAECWFTANPQSSADPFSQRFIVPYLDELNRNGFYEDDIHLIVVMNWRDNPWHDENSEKLRKWDYENRPRAEYDWIWEGKFNDEVEGSIIKAEWFDAAIDAHKSDKLKNVFKPVGARIASHDPFDDGNDAGGFALRHGSIIEKVCAKRSGRIDEVCDWALGLARQNHSDWFVWDYDGMGAGLVRQVSDALKGTSIKHHGFRGSLSGKAQDYGEKVYQKDDGENAASNKKRLYKDVFYNNRAQYYVDRLAFRFYNVYRSVVKGEYIDPAHMISICSEGVEDIVGLRSQISSIPRKVNSNGLIQLVSKKDMKTASPNESDAIMMTMFEPPAIKEKKKVIPRPRQNFF